MLQNHQEFDFQVVHCPSGKHGNAYVLSRQCSQTPELTEEEKKEMFGDSQPADNLSDALGHIQMVFSPEPHPVPSNLTMLGTVLENQSKALTTRPACR